jgi:hypothetical protein
MVPESSLAIQPAASGETRDGRCKKQKAGSKVEERMKVVEVGEGDK